MREYLVLSYSAVVIKELSSVEVKFRDNRCIYIIIWHALWLYLVISQSLCNYTVSSEGNPRISTENTVFKNSSYPVASILCPDTQHPM